MINNDLYGGFMTCHFVGRDSNEDITDLSNYFVMNEGEI